MWFTASLLFRSDHPGAAKKKEALWEEQIVLLDAEDESVAERKAAQHGQTQEHEYRNLEGELVHWTFVQVESVCRVDASVLEDGIELFSRFLRDAGVRSLLTPFEG